MLFNAPMSPPLLSSTLSRLALLYLSVFGLLIGLSFVQSVFRIFRVTVLDEHRVMASTPQLSLLLSSDTGAFADALNQWANDRAGFRDLLIELKNQIDYSVFGVSKKVYIGSDGWLFERATTNNRIAVERMTDDDLTRIEHAFASFAQLLRTRGIRQVVIDYPDKSAFYSEHLPINAPNIPKHGKIEHLRNFLRNLPEIIFIAVEDILEPHKRDQNLYYKTDLHVSLIGSVDVVKEIVNRIAAAEGRGGVVWRETFAWQKISYSGSEDRFLALVRPVREVIVSSNDLVQLGADTPESRWITDDSRRIEYPGLGAYPVFDWEVTSRPERCREKLPGAALFGDSFSDSYWSLGLQNYFCFLRRARTPEERLLAYVDDIPPGTKYFIFQFLDPYLLTEFPRMLQAPVTPR